MMNTACSSLIPYFFRGFFVCETRVHFLCVRRRRLGLGFEEELRREKMQRREWKLISLCVVYEY